MKRIEGKVVKETDKAMQIEMEDAVGEEMTAWFPKQVVSIKTKADIKKEGSGYALDPGIYIEDRWLEKKGYYLEKEIERRNKGIEDLLK